MTTPDRRSSITTSVVSSGGGGAVTSVDGQTGAVDLSASYDALGAAAAAQAASQPLDSDLTTIAALTATTNNFIVSVASAWASRTPAQVKTTLALDNVDNTSDASKTFAGTQITSGTIPIARIPTGTTSSTVPLGGVITAGGPTGDSSHTLSITYNAAGQVTAVSTNAIAITESQVTNLTTDLAAKAPIASPTFTGTTTAPEFTASGLTGATAASRYGGATTSGAPVSGTWAVGDWIVAQDAKVWVCTVAGTPGTWVAAGGSGALTSAHLFVGNASNVATDTAITGDVTINNSGVTAIGATKVTNAMLAGSIDLTAKVTGILPVANGGQGANTLAAHGVLIGNTTSAVNVTTAGSSGQVLTSNGASADPTFQNVDISSIANGAIVTILARVNLK